MKQLLLQLLVLVSRTPFRCCCFCCCSCNCRVQASSSAAADAETDKSSITDHFVAELQATAHHVLRGDVPSATRGCMEDGGRRRQAEVRRLLLLLDWKRRRWQQIQQDADR